MGKRIDLEWNDTHALPAKLDLMTSFVFRRMGEETLNAVGLDNGKSRILDVGCGMGIDTGEMAKKGHYLVGLEPSGIMLAKARDWLKGWGVKASLVQGIGEEIPFRAKSFDKIVCKGALDHFYDPEAAIREMAQIAKDTGRVIIAVTNYESLGCCLARLYLKIKHLLFNKKGLAKGSWIGYGNPHTLSLSDNNSSQDLPQERHYPWEPPEDHTFKFDYFVLKKTLAKYLVVESLVGVSLFWNFPHWHGLVEKLPKRIAWALLIVMDKIAAQLPIFSDVLVCKCRVR
jgi:ubiquinone/menaquinone biosynthesis C-methylase UbiE